MATKPIASASAFRCPTCGERDNEVRDSRPRTDGMIFRRRYCNSCTATIKTVEVPEEFWDALASTRGEMDRVAAALTTVVTHFNSARRAVRAAKDRKDVHLISNRPAK